MEGQRLKQTQVGMIPEDWEVLELRQISKVIDSLHVTPDYSSDGIPMVRATDVKRGNLHLERTLRVTREVYDEFTRNHMPRRNDIVMSRVGTYFVTSFVETDEPFCIGQNTVVICPSINSRFVYYSLNSRLVTRQIEEELVGSGGQETISLEDIRELLIPKPTDRSEIEAISRILSDLDSKIELDSQMNKTLEAIGQAIFKHWFIDFQFPNKDGTPYKSSRGEMVHNEELGKEIPRNWMVKPIDGVADFLNGLAMQKYPAENENEFLPVIKIRELREGVTDSSDKASPNIPREYVVVDGDVLFSWSGSLEVVVWTSGRGALNQHLFKVTSKDYPKWFYYYWLLQHLPEYRRIAEGKATTMGHIQRHHLKSSLVLVPDKTDLQTMHKILSSVVEKIIEVNIQSRKLSQMRDLLLPKLMSGKIRVRVEAR